MKIAITGGIGSGKTTVCKLFEEKGYFVFYSDIEAKKLANTNPEIKKQIISLFGEESYIDGVYNTSYIRNIVFNDNDKLKQLNKCFDGFIIKEYLKQSSGHKISFFESALIFEHNMQNHFDLIIGVYCSEAETINRIKKRNGFNEEEILKIINSQMNSEEKMTKCNVIIDTTDGADIENYLILNNFKQKYGNR